MLNYSAEMPALSFRVIRAIEDMSVSGSLAPAHSTLRQSRQA
jgi:hypothetical protein